MIVQANNSHLKQLAELFDGYRIFYKQQSDIAFAEAFIKERIEKRDSKIFIFNKEQKPVGFTQLYPSFSSVSMKRLWILNDLFVLKGYRKAGVAKALLVYAEEFAK